MIRPTFHKGGVTAWLTECEKRLAKKAMAVGPRFFIIMGESLSGPMAFEFFDFLIAAAIMAGVIMIGASVGFFFCKALKVFLNS